MQINKLIKNYNFCFKKIFFKLNIIIINITMILNLGCCNAWKKHHIPKYLNIEQGTYLTQQDIQKIYIGTTKDMIISNIGFPTLYNLFGSNKWYYVYCHYNSKKKLKYQTIELEFDANNILIAINTLSNLTQTH